MLGLPKSTEIQKKLDKKVIYAKFKLNSAEQKDFDADISRIRIINEISPVSVNIDSGKDVNAVFVVRVILKRKEFNAKHIILISKLISQNMIFVLEYEDKVKLAVYHTKLMQTEWQNEEDALIELKGLNLDTVWDNIVSQIGGFTVEEGNDLTEQIEINDKRAKLLKEIERLEKQARKEKQPKKKFELVQKIKKLQSEMERLK